MKKKGLIIATIVMVLVLAVSLTTATYAWFTVSDVTTIDGFDVQVASDQSVFIGVKTNSTYDPAASDMDFISGEGLSYAGVDGQVGGGTWSGGSPGLGYTINHGIEWGEQRKAVGVTEAVNIEDATYGNTGLIGEFDGTLIAANGGAYNSETATEDQKNEKLLTPTAAKANVGETVGEVTKGGDYAYLFLGVQAAKDLTTNELILFLDADTTESSVIGILAAIHVAYRFDDGAWTDKQFFEGNWNDKVSSLNFAFATEDQTNAYKSSLGKDAVTKKGGAVIIPLNNSLVAGGNITQIELVIYIAGSDKDCLNQAAVNVKGSISIFFNTVVQAAQQG